MMVIPIGHDGSVRIRFGYRPCADGGRETICMIQIDDVRNAVSSRYTLGVAKWKPHPKDPNHPPFLKKVGRRIAFERAVRSGGMFTRRQRRLIWAGFHEHERNYSWANDARCLAWYEADKGGDRSLSDEIRKIYTDGIDRQRAAQAVLEKPKPKDKRPIEWSFDDAIA